MSKVKRWLVCALMCVLLANCVVVTSANAASPLISISAPSGSVGNVVSVTIDTLVDDTITDGRLEIRYDPLALTYEGLAKGGAWSSSTSVVTSVNDSREGEIIFAFTGDSPAAKGTIFTVYFRVVEAAKSVVKVVGSQSYVNPNEDGASLDVSATVDGTVPPSAGGIGGGGGITGASSVFTDLNYTGEFQEAIDYMVYHKIMNGVSADRFAPQSTMTRAMMVTILYRAANEPVYDGGMPFTDVPEGAYYYDAVRWAVGAGVTLGTTDTTFSPSAKLTREQIVTFLYRYAELKGMSLGDQADLSAFTDLASVHSYAMDAMTWGVGQGIIKGVSPTTINPRGSATRAQVAVMLYRFLMNTH